MKFKLPRQKISKDLLDFCSYIIKKNKVDVPRATPKVVRGLPPILREIEKRGLPPYLVLKKLQGKLGYGIFLHPKAPPILKGDPIAPYAGEIILRPENEEDDSDYTFALVSGFHLTREEQQTWDPHRSYHPRRLYSIDLDARKKGNFTRFINHSDEPNIEAHFVRTPTSPFELIYVAKKKILPGEQLLVCYEGEDKSYWGALKIKPFPMTPRTFLLSSSIELPIFSDF